MALWVGNIRRKTDEFAFKARGLDTLALAKAAAPSENKPVFNWHLRGGLVFRHELRSEEEFLKSFTPFVNKKTPEQLKRLRKAFFEPNGKGESLIDEWLSLAGIKGEGMSIEEQEELENIYIDFFSTTYNAPPVPEEEKEEASVSLDYAASYTTPEDIREILGEHDRIMGGGSRANTGGAMVGGGGGGEEQSTEEAWGEEDTLKGDTAEQLIGKLTHIYRMNAHFGKIEVQSKTSEKVKSVLGGMRVALVRKTIDIYDNLGTKEQAKLRVGHDIPSREELMGILHVQMRKDADFLKNSPGAKLWEDYFKNKLGIGRGGKKEVEGVEMTSKRAREEQAKTFFSSENRRRLFIATGKATSFDAINAGLLRASKYPPGSSIAQRREHIRWLTGKETEGFDEIQKVEGSREAVGGAKPPLMEKREEYKKKSAGGGGGST